MGAEVRREELALEIERAQEIVRDTLELNRPGTRADCSPCAICQEVRDGQRKHLGCGHTEDEMVRRSRPCIFVGCRVNLFLEVTPIGSLKFTRPDLEAWEMKPDESCVLDMADRGALTLEEAGEVMNVSRERARQLETGALLEFKIKGGGRLR